jgi:hypothetical protein
MDVRATFEGRHAIPPIVSRRRRVTLDVQRATLNHEQPSAHT